MKQNKDKQIRELKEEKKIVWVALVVLIIMFMMYVIGSYILEYNLGQELQFCQDKVPIWSFKIICWDYMNLSRISFEGDYDVYKDYKEQVDYYNNIKECKVIE